MKFERIGCVVAESDRARDGYEELANQYDFVALDEADVIVALGGDGFMLNCLHQHMDRKLPIYGMNRGTIGFLMNEYRVEGLLERINSAEKATLYPLIMTATTADGREHDTLAFNEVALIRRSQQSANIQVIV